MVGLLFYTIGAHAKNYYLSSNGSDNYDGTSPLTPWQTLGKLNSFFGNLQPGDSVLFRRGETFYGSITINKSGQAGLPIVISAYGLGEKPVITGFTAVSSWTNLGGGIYESTSSIDAGLTIKTVSIDNVLVPMGRYPNANSPNGGYLTYTSHNSNTSISGSSLPFIPTAATLVLRENAWRIDKLQITAYSGGAITYTGGSTYYSPTDGFGYFIQNHLGTLDQFGEWYYNSSARKLYMYFGSKNPDSSHVSTAMVDNLITASSKSYIRFESLNLIGVNSSIFNISNCNYFVIKDCEISQADNGIYCYPNGINAATIINNVFSFLTNDGLELWNGSNNTIIDNVFSNIGSFAGYGGNGDGGNIAIHVIGSGHLIERNKIDTVGYHAIRFEGGNNTIVRNNSIDYFGFIKDDGAGIYTYNGSNNSYTGQKVEGNIILNGIGARKGRPDTLVAETRGIYLDENSNGIEVKDNSIAYCASFGLFCHGCHDNIFTNNTVFDNGDAKNNNGQVLWWQRVSTQPIRNLTVRKNIFFSKEKLNDVEKFWSTSGTDDVAKFGTFDSNYICRPMNEPNGINGNNQNGVFNMWTSSYIWTSLDVLKTMNYGYDLHSKKTVKAVSDTSNIRYVYNINSNNLVVPLLKTYVGIDGTLYSGAINLAPYSSVILLDSVFKTNSGPSVTITSPINNDSYSASASISILANASDTDGSITKVDFYNGNTLLGSDSTSPYSFTWNNVTAGNYTLTAKATDNSSLVTTSSPVNIVVTTGNLHPTISIVKPTADTTSNGATAIYFLANASDLDGKVSKVNFYDNGVLLQHEGIEPWEFVRALDVGVHNITATAKDNGGDSTTSAVRKIIILPANTAPIISITNPANYSTFTSPTDITINAIAADADGSITKVDFYSGNTFLGSDNTSPYSFTWNNVVAGKYSLTAKATDSRGFVAVSDSVNIAVNTTPSVSITSPMPNSTYDSAQSVTIEAEASDSNGIITKVDFYNGDNLLGSDNTRPYNFTWKNIVPGNYSLRAKAYDNDGSSKVSTIVPVIIAPPVAFAFTSFTGTVNKNENLLTWITTNCKNTSYFKVLRGQRRTSMKQIGKIQYENNNLPCLNYTFTDPAPFSSTNYYKISAVDKFGKIISSSIIALNSTTNTMAKNSHTEVENVAEIAGIGKQIGFNNLGKVTMEVSPNPSASIISIYTNGLPLNKDLKVFVLSSTGVVLKTINCKTSGKAITINISSLSGGVYILQASSGYTNILSQFIKL
jgi:parallel beta-helix repeat protein